MILIKILSVITIIVLAIEIIYRPRVDRTRDGEYLLWYGRNNRKYFKL